jgi:hypothetical protein
MNWRKSTYSGQSGGNCVEVANWRKTSYSGAQGGNCVEVADTTRRVLVRDTKTNGRGPVLRFTPDAWRKFTGELKRSLASDAR